MQAHKAAQSNSTSTFRTKKPIRVLNLYAGIGGNRKLWKHVTVTAVEQSEAIAAIYKEYYPSDTVVIADAHEYLLHHYKEFDFIWSSPPCQTHSRARYWSSKGGLILPKYPDWQLWQEILFLHYFATCPWVVENVISYYKPFLPPQAKVDKHYLWSNVTIPPITIQSTSTMDDRVRILKRKHGFDLKGKKGINKKQVMRNTVNPELGLYLLQQALVQLGSNK